MADGGPSPKIISSHFKIILISVLILTILLLVASLFLSCQGELSQVQKQLFENCSTAWKMGFGTIVGLLGGKAA